MAQNDGEVLDHHAAPAQVPIRPYSPDWDPFRETAMGQYLLEREQTFLTDALTASDPPFRLLDIASGTGRVTEPLRHRPGYEITGLDADFDSLRLFNGRSGRHAAVMADATELPFASESFDGAEAIQCVRYFAPVEFLRECNRVLKPGGSLILQAVNRWGYKRVSKHVLKRASVPPGSHILASGELLGLLHQHGFTVEKVRGYNWVPFKPRFSSWSDSRLVGYAATLERTFRLDRCYRGSPWIMVAAKKVSDSP